MEKKQQYPKGVYYNKPHEKAPDFIRGSIVLDTAKVSEFILEENTDKIYIDMKLNKDNEIYLTVNTYMQDKQKTNK